jgi:hypothetical protein
MKPEGSLLCLQGPSTGPYPKPDESHQFQPNLFFEIHLDIILPLTSRCSQWSLCVIIIPFTIIQKHLTLYSLDYCDSFVK